MIAIQDAAAEFSVSAATLYGLIKKGRLKRFRRVGDKRTFLDRDDLAALLAFREVPVKTE